MRNRKSNSEKRKGNSENENSDEEGSTSNGKSNLVYNVSDSDESNSHKTVFSVSEEENSSDSSTNVRRNVKRRKAMHPKELMSDSSDSGDETCEKCAICLRSIFNQEVGSPEGCDHLFCSVCIIEWSKNSNVCPLDRQQFSIILVRKNKNGKVVKQLPVEEPKSFYMYDEDEDYTYCEVCGESDREDTMLLCDGCQRGFHIECLTPPLEEVPAEEEWFCPSCSLNSSYEGSDDLMENLEELNDLVNNQRLQTTRRRTRTGARIRTRFLERIRVAVNRIVTSCFLDADEEESEDDYTDDDDDNENNDDNFDFDYSESEDSFFEATVSTENKPGTSGTQKRKTSSKKEKTKSRKPSTRKKTAKRKVKRYSKKKKSTGCKRKRKGRSTVISKSLKITNADGSVKLVKTKSYNKRRKQKAKKKVKTAASLRKSSGISSTPKTVKGRLALTLGMIPPKKPGQLLPDVKVKTSKSDVSGIDINRARAGIPRLHIFEPRHELQLYSSGSDGEEHIGEGNGSVATIVQPRITVSSIRDRKRAALLLQSSSTAPKPKPIVEEPPKEIDILGSILDSQTIWHSKNTNVKINEDGSIEVLKKSDKNTQSGNGKEIDVRGTPSEGLTTQTPTYPGSTSRPGGFRPYNRTTFGEPRANQDGSVPNRGNLNQSGMGFSRFGSASRNGREGYTNYLNNMPQGPTPFCRGGPPLRFRMPSRQQLRRIPFPPRTNRSPWNNDEDEEEEEEENESKKKQKEEQPENRTGESKKTDDEDVDLYSDIETNLDKADSSEQDESSSTSYPALGPPPEPPAFLLGIDENGDVAVNKTKSEVYDPAEPCDSEDEMVIDENLEKVPSPEEKESEQEPPAPNYSSAQPLSPADGTSPKHVSQRVSTEDEDEECPIFSIYSSASREFSQKEEEEREREIAEEKRKLEVLELEERRDVDNSFVQDKTEKKGAEEERLKETENKELSTDKSTESEVISLVKKRVEEPKKPQKSDMSSDLEKKTDKSLSQETDNRNDRLDEPKNRSRSGTPLEELEKSHSGVETVRDPSRRSRSTESEKSQREKNISNTRDKSCSVERSSSRISKKKSKSCESDSEVESKKPQSDEDEDGKISGDGKKREKTIESESEYAQTKIVTGLEGLDVEEVSSDNRDDDDDFIQKRSLSSFSLSELSNRSHESPSRRRKKKKKKKRGFRKVGRKYDEEEGEDIKEKQKSDDGDLDKNENEDIENERLTDKHKKRKSESVESDRQILGNKDNKKCKSKEKEKDLSWKKPSKKEKNYREGKKRSKERGRSKSKERRKSRSPSPKKDKKKSKDRKKKSERKKDIERYDVRKIVKNKEIRKTDAFGRDIISKSRSMSRSRSRSPVRERSRNMLRRDSRSYTRSRSRSYRRGRSPIRRRYLRSRTKSRSKSLRKSFSRSRSRSRSMRKSKKKLKSKDRLHGRSRSRGRKSRSRRRSPSRSRSRSPVSRVARGKRPRPRRSWSHNSRSLSFSPRRSRTISRTPLRLRRSYTRSASSSWSRGRTSIPRGSSLEKLTVVLKTKDKKKGKKKKDGKRNKRDDERRKQTGNSKEVFASGDNVLVSVNFGNNNNSSSNNNNGSASNELSRNPRLDSMSPAPSSDRKKKRGSDYETEKVSKKSKKSNPISKNVVDMALSNSCSKRAKKLTRLSEKDAEVILNRKPVAVIDLDMSPYREQTPSPINVVVVSDSGSGDEDKEPTPQRQDGSPGSEPDKAQAKIDAQSTNVSIPNSPVANGYLMGPKTPPEPQIKFSIAKPQQLRQIANPLGDDDDEDDDEDEEDAEEAEEQEFKRIESLDRRIEKELDGSHKGPNTPPEPRGPSTPQTPPSPQTSPDAYDPFEPTKSRSPTPDPLSMESHQQSPAGEKMDEQQTAGIIEALAAAPSSTNLNETEKTTLDPVAESPDNETPDIAEKGEAIPVLDTPAALPMTSQPSCTSVQEARKEDSPEKKISVSITTPQSKVQSQTAIQKSFTSVMKPLSMTPVTSTSAATVSSSLSMPFSSFSLPSPTKTRTGSTPASQPIQMTGIQRLQHRLGSPVNRTPNSVKSTPEKRSTPRTEAGDASGYRSSGKRNGEPGKSTRPLQDTTNETIDMTADMDDSPYSPASSEGDDLFDPPMEPIKAGQTNAKTIQPGYKPPPSKAVHKSPIKQLSKFDLLFGPSGPTLSPVKVGSKKPKPSSKGIIQSKTSNTKTTKKNLNKKGIALKMDEDQLRILDELPSSAVELQVKDKFLKKLNRQERVVDEVKTVLKPHYARKHITKEEYKDILRRSVPKICHSRSGEINPSKIQSLIEAYVKKFRHAKKKGGSNAMLKTKVK